MVDEEHHDVSIEVLHRMIAYIRAEALRLDVMDVALLLEHAEDAVMSFAPASSARLHGLIIREASRVEH